MCLSAWYHDYHENASIQSKCRVCFIMTFVKQTLGEFSRPFLNVRRSTPRSHGLSHGWAFHQSPIWILVGWQRGKGSFTKLIHSTIRGIATLYPVTFPAVSLYSHTPRVCQFYWSATLYHSVLVRFHSQRISPLSGFLGISLSSDCIMKVW